MTPSLRTQLGPSRIVLAEGSTLFITTPEGAIPPDAQLGFIASDTRLLSRYERRINGRPWMWLSSASVTPYAARWYYLSPGHRRRGRGRTGTVAMTIERTLRGGVHEDITIANYGGTAEKFSLAIEASCDFSDLFEVRGLHPQRRRRVAAEVLTDPPGVRWSYTREDFSRGLSIRVVRSDSPASVPSLRGPQRRGNRAVSLREPKARSNPLMTLSFDIALEPGQNWNACLHLIPEAGGRRLAAPSDCCARVIEDIERSREPWYKAAAEIDTPVAYVQAAYRQALDDLTMLRLAPVDSPGLQATVGAGIPWFATLFGRDSLVISLQMLPFTRWFAPAVLRALAGMQTTEVDDHRDAQPGKIMHEIRHGELAHFHEIPHTPYYGTADATALFIIALHETYHWTGDRAIVEELLPAAERALGWLDQYGDLDGDGFQEYLNRTPHGLRHQGWKDSGDPVVHADGSPAEPPIALVELQGYAYDAKRRMAVLYESLGRTTDAARLRGQADVLRGAFEERFWWPEEQTYYFALDGKKNPVKSVASNAGHALWSGIAGREHGAAVVRRLLATDMFSGWGIRTLSARHPAFNPYVYQLGSVWPHDNGLIALGFARYGFRDEAARVAAGIFEAAQHFRSHQMPELFAGLDREPRAFPVQYPHANIPQGWAAGSVFILLQALLGLRADAPNKRLFVHPVLPKWLPGLRLSRLPVGDATVDLEFLLDGSQTRTGVLEVRGNLQVIEEPVNPPPPP